VISFYRPWYRPPQPKVALSDNWQEEMDRAEKTVPFLRPGQQKEVNWFALSGQPTEWALGYLHGLSASRHEITPTVEKLSAILRANVFWARMSGHGTRGEDFRKVTADDWLRDGEEAVQILNKIGQRRVLIATSTGATVAMAEALWHPQDLQALILISPNFGPRQPQTILLGGPLGPTFGHLILGPEHSWVPKSPEQEQWWYTHYAVEGLTAMMDLVHAVERMPIQNLKTPCLIFFTPTDNVINLDQARRQISRTSACQIKMITAEDHVLAGAIMSPSSTDLVMSEILAFLRTIHQ